jgi:hypothetical protein
MIPPDLAKPPLPEPGLSSLASPPRLAEGLSPHPGGETDQSRELSPSDLP